ncbi:unnamed protein product [Cuscuta epithymum]|uniref:Reverse transcriptase zinc-binding domain-containing protein n=1 Tax=Cuscuta epithymum TaxID=186058 RepID=A0AAV0C3H8_9ASTE|nr:unnamed protein product [Cuscuta epithymum]
MVTTEQVAGLEQANVASLLNVENPMVTTELLMDIFDSRDVSSIRNIPISTRHVPDIRQWRWEENGHFSVQSCYRKMVCNGCLPTKDILRARRANCPASCGLCGSEEESILHIFHTCSVVKEAWAAVPWSRSRDVAGSFMELVHKDFEARRRGSSKN